MHAEQSQIRILSLKMWTFIVVISFTVQSVFSGICPPHEDIAPCFCKTLGNEIDVLCFHLDSLEELTNSVEALKGRKIFSFEIKNSKFDYIPHDLFANVTIKEVVISDSNFSRIGNLGEAQFKGLENSLETLKFTKAFTKKHPFAYVSMEHLTQLTTLELINSYVEVLHNEWFVRGPYSLKTVRFVKGNIRAIGSRALKPLINLQVIDLSDNELTYIPRQALPVPALHLEELNLERNKVETLPEDFFSDMPNLKKVNLELNEFGTIDQTIWRPVWSDLEFLNIDYNPMICDKNIKWIYESSTDLEKKLAATCYKPFTLMDRELHSLKLEELK